MACPCESVKCEINRDLSEDSFYTLGHTPRAPLDQELLRGVVAVLCKLPPALAISSRLDVLFRCNASSQAFPRAQAYVPRYVACSRSGAQLSDGLGYLV